MGHLLGFCEKASQLPDFLVTLGQLPLVVGPNKLVRVNIAVELLYFGLPLGQVFGEFTVFVEQAVVLLGQQLVLDFEVFGRAEPEPSDAEFFLELCEISFQASDLALVEVQIVLAGRKVVDALAYLAFDEVLGAAACGARHGPLQV